MYELIKKEFFNKEFLTSKSFIKMVCFTMVLIFAVVMGSIFGYVSADEVSAEDLWLNMEGYESSDLYDSSNANVGYIRPSNEIQEANAILGSNAVLNHTYSFPGAETPVDFNMDDVKYYVITGDIYSSTWRVYLFTTDECHIYLESPHQFVVDTGTEANKYYVFDVTPWGDGTYLTSPYAVFPENCASNDSVYYSVANFSMYYLRVSMSNSHYILASNMDILTYQGSMVQSTILYEYINWKDGGSANHIVNVNYLYENAHSLGGFDNLVGIGTGSGSDEPESTETSANNLYLNNAKWTFSIPKWSNLTGYSGNATFSSSLNDFQTDNLEDFYLRFQFRIDTTVSYVDSGEGGTSGGGHGTSVSGNNISTGYLQKTFSYKDSTTGNNYKDVQLQYFYNQGCSQSFMTLNGIFDRCMLQKLSLNNSSSSDTSFYNWYNDAVNSNTHTVTKAMLYCYATLYDSDGGSSGNCTYYYNLLTGESGVTDSSMSINSNPVVDEEGNVEYDPSDDVGSGTSINNNNSNSGVNVTQTVNVNNDSSDSKSWLWTLISSLLTSGSDDDSISQAGMSDTLVNLVGINPWISLMSTVFGFVPATVWTSLSVAFIAVLGIMVVAFVLRVLLDLL